MPAQRKRVGRPPRITRAAIADAVLELGDDDLTMKRVATHLGVSVPGLYHYVKGRDDLVRLAAQQALARVRMPEDTGQHWSTWLREWARYTRDVMKDRPELLNQFANGGLDDDRLIEVAGRALDALRRGGFEPDPALHAWEAVNTLALGSAIEDIRERATARGGRPWIARVFLALARREPDDLPTLRSIIDSGYQPDRDAAFEARLTTLLVGIAVEHGLPLDDEVTGVS
jgi:AcrR family transcriptional regulator